MKSHSFRNSYQSAETNSHWIRVTCIRNIKWGNDWVRVQKTLIMHTNNYREMWKYSTHFRFHFSTCWEFWSLMSFYYGCAVHMYVRLNDFLVWYSTHIILVKIKKIKNESFNPSACCFFLSIFVVVVLLWSIYILLFGTFIYLRWNTVASLNFCFLMESTVLLVPFALLLLLLFPWSSFTEFKLLMKIFLIYIFF